MMADGPIGVISDRREITAAWLTSALRSSGHLPQGNVKTLTVKLWRRKTLADLYRLEATYSRGVIAPPSFILKLSRPEALPPAARQRRWKEHVFYTQLAPVMDDAPIPRAFATVFDPETRRSCLLMEDLTPSHAGPPSPLPPTPDQLCGAIKCLARIHAGWWTHADLAAAAAERDETWVRTRTAATHHTVHRFLDELGAHLPAATRTALETVALAWPTMLRRSAEMPLTVVHGDAHPWNFLTPLDPNYDRTCLLDWEGWSVEPGPHDLASLIALHLPVTARRGWEEQLLRQYLQTLREHGVTDYDLLACRDDYRRAVARRVISPVGMWSRGTRARSWWPALEHITAAFHDLQCVELLGVRVRERSVAAHRQPKRVT